MEVTFIFNCACVSIILSLVKISIPNFSLTEVLCTRLTLLKLRISNILKKDIDKSKFSYVFTQFTAKLLL